MHANDKMRADEALALALSVGIIEDNSLERGGALWLFGSRAAGSAQETSDWDLLLLSATARSRRRHRTKTIDLVTVPWPDAMDPNNWLGSELAAHVARYGDLLYGKEDWTSRIDPSLAAKRKRERTCERLAALARAWHNLLESHRDRRALLLRRDAQRVFWLTHQSTVPPTSVLDEQWDELGVRERRQIFTTAIPDTSPCIRDALLRTTAPDVRCGAATSMSRS